VFAVLGNVTNKNAWRPDTLIKQGGEADGDWGGCLGGPAIADPAGVGDTGAQSGEMGGLESKVSSIASLFNEAGEGEAALPRHEQAVMRRLRRDEAMQLDALIEGLKGSWRRRRSLRRCSNWNSPVG